jgi:hypothetical protein
MVEVFQKNLVKKSLISQVLADASTQGTGRSQNPGEIQKGFERAYVGHENEFKAELLEARDYLGKLLAETWRNLDPNFLTYHTILRALLKADRKLTVGEHQKTIRECFSWREISVVPDSLLLRPHTLLHSGINSKPKIDKDFSTEISETGRGKRINNGSPEEVKSIFLDHDLSIR